MYWSYKKNRLDITYMNNLYIFNLQSLYIKDKEYKSFTFMKGYCDKFDANLDELFGTLKGEVVFTIPYRILCASAIYFNGKKMSASYFLNTYTTCKKEY